MNAIKTDSNGNFELTIDQWDRMICKDDAEHGNNPYYPNAWVQVVELDGRKVRIVFDFEDSEIDGMDADSYPFNFEHVTKARTVD